MRNLKINEIGKVSGGDVIMANDKGTISIKLTNPNDVFRFNNCFFRWLGWGVGSYYGIHSFQTDDVCEGYKVSSKIDNNPSVTYYMTPIQKEGDV